MQHIAKRIYFVVAQSRCGSQTNAAYCQAHLFRCPTIPLWQTKLFAVHIISARLTFESAEQVLERTPIAKIDYKYILITKKVVQ